MGRRANKKTKHQSFVWEAKSTSPNESRKFCAVDICLVSPKQKKFVKSLVCFATNRCKNSQGRWCKKKELEDDHLSFFHKTKSSIFCVCGKACFATAQLPSFLLQEMTAVILAVIACHQKMTRKTMTVILLEVKNLLYL